MTYRARYGTTYDNGKYRPIRCIVTGEMSDGRKVWTECDENKEPIHTDAQYHLLTGGNWSEFIRI